MISNIGNPIHEALQFHETTKPADSHRLFESTKTNEQKSYWLKNKDYIAERLQNLWGIKKERALNDACYFVTSRELKFQEVKKLMEGLNILQAPLKLPTLDQEEDLVKLAVYRVFQAFKQLQAPCFIEEAALNVDIQGYQKGFPGHQYRIIVEQQIGKKRFAQDNAGRDAATLSAFAYTEDGKTAHVFTGQTKGKIVDPGENWEEVDGWDPFFQPEGYVQTLAQLRRFKHIVNMRQLPCAEMRSVMRQKEYSGVYETHITVYNCAQEVLTANGHQNPLEPDSQYKIKFKEVCGELGLKPLFIGMDSPNKPMQLQTAAYHTYKNYADAVRHVNEDARQLIKKGLPVLRVRLEAMLGNRESPKTDEEALKADHGNYFEFHARLAEVPPERFEPLKAILERFCRQKQGSHGQGEIKTVYSTVGGGSRFFINLRSYKIGSGPSLEVWRTLLGELSENGFKTAKEVKPEYCVYDQEPKLDSMTV